MRVLSILIVVLTALTVIFPAWLILPLYFFAFLPLDIPYGISGPSKLEQNFHKHHFILEAIVTTARTDSFTSAKHGYWNLTGHKVSEPQGAEYKQLYRAMRQAHVQKIHVLEREPLEVELVTDEQPAMIDTNRYGYIYVEDPDDYGSSGYYQLNDHWFLFEEIP